VGFWSNLFGGGTPNHAEVTANANPPDPEWAPGDPNGVSIEGGEDLQARALPYPQPSLWSGWPGDWSTPGFNTEAGIRKLVDTAWACLDRNSSILSSMPVYRLRSGRIIPPHAWMTNPDPMIYTSWAEFAKQLFWDYMLGEAFVMPFAYRADGYPMQFRVLPPWLVSVEMNGGRREYRLGHEDVTGEILHIRYKSTTTDPRGIGPLEAAGARLTASGVLQRYVSEIADNGGIPPYVLHSDTPLKKEEADDLQEQWAEARRRNLGRPAVLSGGVSAQALTRPSAKELALLELSQFTDSRIAILLGTPPFLVGLPSGGDSMTYANVSSLFDFHDRAMLRPMTNAVMSALSGWALPAGQTVELNRDEYVRQTPLERAQTYTALHGIGAITTEEIRAMERLHGEASASSLSGAAEAGPTGEPTETETTEPNPEGAST
jgi:HK97 family phage portal protein